MVNKHLQRLYPQVGSVPMELQQVLSLCFSQPEEIKVSGMDERNKTPFAKFTFELMRKVRAVIIDITNLTDEYAEITDYIKPVYW